MDSWERLRWDSVQNTPLEKCKRCTMAAVFGAKRKSRVKHARYYWLPLAESHLTRRLFGKHGAEDCGAAGTSGIELGGWQMKKLDNKGVGDGKVSQKSVNLRLGFASQGRTTIWPSTTTTICCDGPRENRPNRKAQVYNRYVSEAKMEILGKI